MKPKNHHTNSRFLVGLATILILVLYFRSFNHASSTTPLLKTDNFLALPSDPLEHKSMPLPWAVSYSPYTHDGECKPVSTIALDLKEIRSTGIDTVRLFSADCDVLFVLDTVPLRLILGLHPYTDTDDDDSQTSSISSLLQSLDTQMDEIERWAHKDWSRIDMLVVGSQGVFAEEYSRADLVRMLNHVRARLSRKPRFQALLTTAEPVESWVSPTRYNAASVQEYKKFLADPSSSIEDNDVCNAVDVVALVVQPYFSATLASDAGALVARDARFARYLCSDDFIGRSHRATADGPIQDIDTTAKAPPIVVLEAGWPTRGTPNGDAVPGVHEQRVALKEIVHARDTQSGDRIPTVLYSYHDELWRDGGELQVEQAFGVAGQYH